MSQASKNADSTNRSQGENDAARGLGQLLHLETQAADVSLRAFREEERQIIAHFCEPERRHLELDSIQRLREELSEILAHCREVAEFEGWLESPGRRWLFDHYCSVAVAEWDEAVAKDQPPRVFRTGPETVQRHLYHCSFCRMARRLAEGRVRMRRANLGRLLRGDQIADDFVTNALADAFFRAAAPRLMPYTLAPGGNGEPTSMAILESESRRLNGQVQTNALLRGGTPHAYVEVNVVWEPTDPVPAVGVPGTDDAGGTKTRQETPPDSAAMCGDSSCGRASRDSLWRDRLAFPNDKHPDSMVRIDADGSCLLPLVVPTPAAERGVVFKYCGRRTAPEDARRLATLNPSNTLPAVVRTRGSLAAAKTFATVLEGDFGSRQHEGAAAPPARTGDAIHVLVGAASFRWSG